jgi:predicted transcriptional regulator of viral defense system
LKKRYTFCNMKATKKTRQVIEPRVLSMVYGHGRGWVFTPNAFATLGDARSVGMALTRLSRRGTIRQLARGLYEYPRQSKQFGTLPPATEEIAKALEGRHATRVQLSGAHAAHALGLTEQVPVRTVYLTDGGSRRVKIGKREIVLKRTTPRNMATAGRTSGLVIQALRWLGQRNVDQKIISRLRRTLKPEDKAALVKDAHLAPAWIGAIFHRLAAKGN